MFGSGSESCYGEAVFCLSTGTAFLFSPLHSYIDFYEAECIKDLQAFLQRYHHILVCRLLSFLKRAGVKFSTCGW